MDWETKQRVTKIMLLVKDTSEIAGKCSRVVMTIGNFDGVHRGHQALIKQVMDRAKELGGMSLVFTFHPHPLKVMAPEKCPPLINLPHQKIELFKELDLDIIVNQNFSREFALHSPRDFVELVLCRPLNPVEIFVGSDFRFGKAREGDVDYLCKLGKELGFKVSRVEPVTYKNAVVSSTMIRELLMEGRVEEAADYMSRPYTISGSVTAGDARGRELGFPTANVDTGNDIIPRKGVYAVRVNLRGESRKGVANIGVRPTFNKNSLAIEVFIFDFNEDCYGEPISLQFMARLRDEIAFSGPEALVAQIRKDIAEAMEILS
jgi:riboflavin kinase/FMN adenylyltransferase